MFEIHAVANFRREQAWSNPKEQGFSHKLDLRALCKYVEQPDAAKEEFGGFDYAMSHAEDTECLNLLLGIVEPGF